MTLAFASGCGHARRQPSCRLRTRELLRHLGRYYVPYSTPQRRRPRAVEEVIETVGLDDRAAAKIATLSVGGHHDPADQQTAQRIG